MNRILANEEGQTRAYQYYVTICLSFPPTKQAPGVTLQWFVCLSVARGMDSIKTIKSQRKPSILLSVHPLSQTQGPLRHTTYTFKIFPSSLKVMYREMGVN